MITIERERTWRSRSGNSSGGRIQTGGLRDAGNGSDRDSV